SRNIVPLARTQAPTGFDRFIVKYRDGSTARRSTTAVTDLANAALRSARVPGAMTSANGARATLSMKHVRKTAVGADLVRASRRLNATESAAFLKQLRSDPSVLYAQPDFMKQRLETIPDDTYFGQLQWDYTDPTGGINATTAWDTSKGEGVVVAVLDTGHVDHPDLDGNIVPGYDFISYYGQTTEEGLYPDVAGDGDGRDADAHDPGDWTDTSMSSWCGRISNSSWHGTHVAGTVAAVGNNASGIAGVAYQAKVQPVRVLGHCGGLTSDIADAIIWASGGEVPGVPMNETPAEVLNLSLGGGGSCYDDPMTQEAIDGAISRGVTVVVAAGNDSDNAANHSPASCKGVITVGATGIDGGKSWFSNYGASVTLSAPGGNATSGSDPDDRWIWSTGDVGATTPEGPGLIGMIGTSQASPHVAGVIALMQSAAVAAGKPVLTPAQVKNILRGTARSFPIAPPMSTPMGAGIVDAAAATLAATQDVGDETAEPLTNRLALPGQTGAAGDELLYSIEVPAGTRSLNLRSYGGSGNVSLYVAYDYIPTAALHDRKSARPGNSEAVVITNPAAGTYYLRMVGEQAFTNVSVMALY
ncbi:S8 family peptidase, partial [Luteimonas cucumeris]|uniref:S8 family peptidase n=1 Tax=Luteimonas cucumeris TaxID=985012 RepID=UPI0011A7C78A